MKSFLTRIILMLGIIMSSNIYCQTDSLLTIINSNAPDTLKIDALNELSYSFLSSNYDSTIYYAQQAVELAKNEEDLIRLGYALKNVGLAYYFMADYKTCIIYWIDSKNAFEEANDPKGTANLLSNIGAIYYTSVGDNVMATDYYLKALRFAEEANDDRRIATVFQNLGAVHESTREYDKAENYLIQAIEMAKTINYNNCIALSALNLGEIYLQQERLVLAEKYLNEAADLIDIASDNSVISSWTYLGLLENKRGNYSKALDYLKKAEEVSNDRNSNLTLFQSYVAYGDVYQKMGRVNRAIFYYKKAYELGSSIELSGNDIKDTFRGLSDAYKNLNDYRSALSYKDSLYQYTIDVYDVEKNNQIENLQLILDIEKKTKDIELLNADNELKSEQIARARLFRNFLIAIALLLVSVVGGVTFQYNYIRKTNKIITEERNKSDRLLLNILPEETADELKHKGKVAAKKFDKATVLFTDFVNFTGTAGKMQPEDLVETIDYYFRHFDDIVKGYGLEKIKTIGDAYMCAGGIPKEDPKSTENALRAAADMVRFVEQTAANPPEGIHAFQIRIGLNCGPLVAGVVGSSKFQYDVWGDTVNIASRMESNSAANRVNVSEYLYEEMKDIMNFEFRGELDVKNKGKMKMYFLDHSQLN